MSIERTYYCEGPDCGGEGGLSGGYTSVHVVTSTPPPYLPDGIIEVREPDPSGGIVRHFCGWDCVMKFAANQPIPERIELYDPDDEEDR